MTERWSRNGLRSYLAFFDATACVKGLPLLNTGPMEADLESETVAWANRVRIRGITAILAPAPEGYGALTVRCATLLALAVCPVRPVQLY